MKYGTGRIIVATIRKFTDESTPDNLQTPTAVVVASITSGTASVSFTAPPGGATWTYGVYLNGLPFTTGASSPIDLTGLAPNTPYVLSVVAINAAGLEGPPTTPVQFVTMPIVIPPPVYTAPTTPTGLTLVAKSDNFINVSWTPSATTDALPLRGYKVYINGGAYSGLLDSTTSPSYVFTDLAASTAYSITVVAFTAVKDSAVSAALNVTTSAEIVPVPGPDVTAPTTPSNLSISSAVVSGVPTVTFTADPGTDAGSGIAYHRVYKLVGIGTPTQGVVNVVSPAQYVAGKVQHIDKAVQEGVTYTFGVDATDIAGNISATATAQITIPVTVTPPDVTPPTLPKNVILTYYLNDGGIPTVNVQAVPGTDAGSGVSKHRIYRVTGTSTPTVGNKIAEITPAQYVFGAVVYDDVGVAFGTTYTYGIDCIDVAGNSTAGMATKTVTTSAAPLWSSTNIGGALPAGSYGGVSSLDVTGGGADIWSTSDQFYFVSQQASGDWRITAKIDSFTNTHASAKAGLMIRDSLAGGGRFAAMFMTPTATNGSTFQYRATTGGAVTSVGTDTLTLPRWIRLDKAGNLFTGYVSSDGVTWTSRGSVTIVMSGQFQFGVAVCSHSQGGSATASFSSLNYAALPPDTTAPTVPSGLSAVVNGQTSITWNWTASTDAGSGVATYTPRLGGVAQTPITGTTFTATGLTAATAYSLDVRATDNAGNNSAYCTAVSATTAAAASTDPVWQTVPNATFTLGTAGEVSYSSLVSHPAGTAYDVDTNSAGTAWPTGVTNDPVAKKLIYSGAGAAATTTGHKLRATNTVIITPPPGDSEADWLARKNAAISAGGWATRFETDAQVTGDPTRIDSSSDFYRNYLYNAAGQMGGDGLIYRVPTSGILGASAMRLTHPGNVGAQSGGWRRMFQDNLNSWPLNTPIYIQYATRWPLARLQATGYAGGYKTSVIAGWGRSGWGNTCQGAELTITNINGYGIVRHYTACSPPLVTFNSPASGDERYQTARDRGAGYTNKYDRYCLYSQWNTGACLRYVANQWMVMYYKITPRGATADIDFRMAYEGDTSFTPVELYSGYANWGNDPFNTLTFTSYSTGRSANAGYADLFFDVTEVIVSPSPIALRQVWT